MTISILNTIPTKSPIWVFNEDSFPCKCCNPAVAMDDGKWTCLTTNVSWLVVDEQPDLTKPHEPCVCDGSCGDKFHKGLYLTFAYADVIGLTWGDLYWLWSREELSQLSPEEIAKRNAEEAERQAREEAQKELESLSSKLAEKARNHEIKAHYKCNKGKKENYPCKYLYSCVGERKTGGAKPTTLHISSECWSHSYTDPLTGQRIEKHACWNLHPGEEGWCKEWETNRLYKPELTFQRIMSKPENRDERRPENRDQRKFNRPENRDHKSSGGQFKPFRSEQKQFKPENNVNRNTGASKPPRFYNSTKPVAVVASKPKTQNSFAVIDDSSDSE
jgi:hypothetical protein